MRAPEARITSPHFASSRARQAGLQLKSAFRDCTTHIVMSPLVFMRRLAALVPLPRLHLIRFHGVLAPHAKLRSAIVPIPAESTSEHAAGHTHSALARFGPINPVNATRVGRSLRPAIEPGSQRSESLRTARPRKNQPAMTNPPSQTSPRHEAWGRRFAVERRVVP